MKVSIDDSSRKEYIPIYQKGTNSFYIQTMGPLINFFLVVIATKNAPAFLAYMPSMAISAARQSFDLISGSCGRILCFDNRRAQRCKSKMGSFYRYRKRPEGDGNRG
jgi:hypothetical protein